MRCRCSACLAAGILVFTIETAEMSETGSWRCATSMCLPDRLPANQHVPENDPPQSPGLSLSPAPISTITVSGLPYRLDFLAGVVPVESDGA
jgi:hypothetical protein